MELEGIRSSLGTSILISLASRHHDFAVSVVGSTASDTRCRCECLGRMQGNPKFNVRSRFADETWAIIRDGSG
jgi:hypothetical protein